MTSEPDPITRLNTALEGRYRIERELGEGGMANVYLARDEKHNRNVALKVLKPELAAAVGADRFLAEIETTANLQHPHILPLFDSGEAGGFLFYVMPYVDGESLRERLDREQWLPVDEALSVATNVAEALDYAHSQGVIHRDIKPENILLQAGKPVVADFGIAKAASQAHDRLTHTGLTVGSLRYMSPEQASGEDVDGRSDIYALACTLYEMLVGGSPFGATRPEAVLASKLLGNVPDLRATRPEVPDTFRRVLERALAPSPDARFASGSDFIAALEESLTELAIARDYARARRGRQVRILATAAAAAFVGVVGWQLVSTLTAPSMLTLAVVPDLPAALDDEESFFVRGVSEDLTTELARAGVRVKDSGAVARLLAGGAGSLDVAEALGVDGIVQVSATRAGTDVSSQLELLETSTAEIVWVEDYRGAERLIMALLGDMTRGIAEEIGVRLEAEALDRLAADAQEVNPQVRDFLQRARYSWQALTEEGFATAEEYYERALIASDSLSAEAWVGLGQLPGLRAQNGMLDMNEAVALAEPRMARARELDPDDPYLAFATATSLVWRDWDWEDGARAFEIAIDANPRDAEMRAYYALLLLYLGRVDEAEEQMAVAHDADPLSSLVQGLRGQFLNARGRYAEAEETLQAAVARGAGLPFLLSTLRTTYHLMGRYEEALDVWRETLEPEGAYTTTGDPEALAALERGYVDSGYEGALSAVANLNVERTGSSWGIATLYTRAARDQLALDWLERAVMDQNPNVPYLGVDPIFDPLHDEPRFQALLEGIGLESQ